MEQARGEKKGMLGGWVGGGGGGVNPLYRNEVIV